MLDTITMELSVEKTFMGVVDIPLNNIGFTCGEADRRENRCTYQQNQVIKSELCTDSSDFYYKLNATLSNFLDEVIFSHFHLEGLVLCISVYQGRCSLTGKVLGY